MTVTTAQSGQIPKQQIVQAAPTQATSNSVNKRTTPAVEVTTDPSKGGKDPNQGKGVEEGTITQSSRQSKMNLNEIPDLHDLSLFVCPSLSSNSGSLANDRISKCVQFPIATREFTQHSLSCPSILFEKVQLNVPVFVNVEVVQLLSSSGKTGNQT